jgi:hypothetical protein
MAQEFHTFFYRFNVALTRERRRRESGAAASYAFDKLRTDLVAQLMFLPLF